MPMFDKLRPAVTVAAQHLQNNMKSKDKEQAPVQSTTARLGGLTGQTKPQMPAKFDFAAAGHSSTTQGLGAASVPFANATAGLMASDGGQSSNPETMFDDSAKEKIQSAIKDGKKVFVAGFSSQGGGHTERMMKPLGQAVGQGDTVVIALPPHWQFDTGNEASNLGKYSQQYKDAGANVVTVQADKAIWGFYKEDGPSDNFRILEEFAMKPQRDTDQTPLYGLAKDKARTGQGFMHKDIMQQVVNIAGKENMDQLQVFEDMDPYLGKAAKKAGVPQSQILGQSNHVLLLDAIKNKSDAFLVKANGGSFDGMMATIDFDPSVNKTASLGGSLDKLGIKPDQKTVDVRKDVVATFMQHGNKIYPDDKTEVTKDGAVMVSRSANEQTIDRGVYMYLNSYTGGLAEHIKERMSGEGEDNTPELKAAYESTMFIVSQKGAFTKEYRANDDNMKNAMHLAQAANFDGVTAASFGAASEMQYLIENDAYQGNFVVMPIEQQNEQEANAHDLLPKALSPENRERVAIADTIEELKAQLDDLVMSRATTTDALQQSGTTMGSMLEATHKPGSIADKAASLLQGTGEMSAQDAALLEENIWRANEPGRKEIRQINKVMIPVLKALSQGESQATIQMTAKDEPRIVNAADVVSSLNSPAKLRELTGVNITNQLARNLSDEIAEDLEPIMDLPEGAVRHYMVDHYMRGPYTEKFNLGC